MGKKRKQIIIIGLGKFGMSVAKSLSKYDCDVLAVDKDNRLVDEVAEYVTQAVRIDAVNEESLKELGVSNFDVAIVGIGDDLEGSIMITLILKELKVPYIIAKSRDDMHTRLLEMIGVDKVVQPEQDIGVRVAKTLMHKNILERMEFGNNYSVVEIQAPANWVGKEIRNLDIRAKYNINIVCIERSNESTKVMPTPSYKIQEGDVLMIVATNEALDEIEK